MHNVNQYKIIRSISSLGFKLPVTKLLSYKVDWYKTTKPSSSTKYKVATRLRTYLVA